MIGDNAPPMDGWQVTPRACPIPCKACERATIPASVVLGEN